MKFQLVDIIIDRSVGEASRQRKTGPQWPRLLF
jgi:hypothetical protein